MKRALLIFLLFTSRSSLAQQDVTSLAASLVKNCKTEREKVSVLFHWITDNISYTTFSKNKKAKPVYTEPDDDGPLKPLNIRVAETVLKRRTAFCDGYARLFTALCNAAGIRSEIICGYANGGVQQSRTRFGVNHYWNAVFLEGKWQLLDATWASGYINLRDGEFVREYNGRYFLASPESFIKTHYPDDPRWTLLADDKVPDEFRYSPFRQKSFVKYGFTYFYPEKGIIDARLGDTVVLELEARQHTYSPISPSMVVDSSFFSHSTSWVFLKPDVMESSLKSTSRMKYIFPVTNPEVQWLYLVYNDDVVMRYRVNVKSRGLN